MVNTHTKMYSYHPTTGCQTLKLKHTEMTQIFHILRFLHFSDKAQLNI
jgi:hypothetical protein